MEKQDQEQEQRREAIEEGPREGRNWHSRVWFEPSDRTIYGKITGYYGTERTFIFRWPGWELVGGPQGSREPEDVAPIRILSTMLHRLSAENRILALTKGAASVETRANIIDGVFPDWMDKTVIARWPNGVVGEYRIRGGHIETRTVGPLEFTVKVELAGDGGLTPEEARRLVRKKLLDALVPENPGPMEDGVWVVRAQVEDKGFRG